MALINYVYAHTKVPGFAVHKQDSSLIWSSKPLAGCDAYAYSNAFSFCGKQPGLDILVMTEPTAVLPGQYSAKVWDNFDCVLTWVDALANRGGKFGKFILYSYDIPYERDYIRSIDLSFKLPPAEKKNAICMINGNKFSSAPGELYSKRVEIAQWFNDHSTIPFDVYGTPPFKLPNYRGPLTPYTQKFATLAKYRFCLCFENIYHPVWSKGGGGDEKLLDCFMCGTVPIYLGCYDIEKYVPLNCFIDFREFKDYAELDLFLKNLSDARYETYLDHIENWVRQGGLRQYSLHRLYDKLLALSAPGLNEAELAAEPWQPGLADHHRERRFKLIDSHYVWSWKELATAPPPQDFSAKKINRPENRDLPSASKILAVVFSKDRAMQLDACLQALLLHCRDLDAIQLKILYTTSGSLHETQYRLLASEYEFAEFVKESDFKRDLLALLQDNRYVLFLVDDNVFVEGFYIADAVQSLEANSDALGFSLRLGKNITYHYMSDNKQNLPQFKAAGRNILKYRWPDAERYFGYPLELSSSIYRVYDLILLLNLIDFSNPNTLEAYLDHNKAHYKNEREALLCFERSVAFCNPVNLVQTVFNNRSGRQTQYSSLALAQKFDEGYRINVDAYSKFIPSAAHQEVELEFKKKNTGPDPDHKAGPATTSAAPSNPEVSIVIVTYNRAHWITEAVRSALNQTYLAREIIIVDDGSTDDTAAKINALADRRIRYIRKEKNEGQPAARNLGILQAAGQYILWLDDDDLLMPDTLQWYVAALREIPACNVLYGKLQYFEDKTGKPLHVFDPLDWSDKKNCLLEYLTIGSMIPNPASLVKKSLYDQVGGYNREYLRAQDYEFWTRAATSAECKKVDQIVCRYRVHGHNISYDPFIDFSYESKIIRSILQKYSLQTIFPAADRQGVEQLQRTAFGRIAESLFQFNDYYNARRYYVKIGPANLTHAQYAKMLECDLYMGLDQALGFKLEKLSASSATDKRVIIAVQAKMHKYLKTLAGIQKALAGGNIDAGFQGLDLLLKSYGVTIDAMLLMGKIYEKTGNPSQALKLYKKAIGCNPENDHALQTALKLASSEKQKSEIAAVKNRLLFVEKLFDDQGGLDAAEFSIGALPNDYRSPATKNKRDDAADRLEQTLKRNPADASIHASLAEIYYGRGDDEKALMHFQQAVQCQPDNAAYHRNLGDFYLVKENNLEKALEIYRRVVALQSGEADALLMAGNISCALGKLKEAQGYFEKILSTDPNNAGARSKLHDIMSKTAGALN